MRWGRMSRAYSLNRGLIIVVIAMLIITISLGLLSACQSDNISGVTDDNNSAGDINDPNDNNGNSNNPNDDLSNINSIYATINDNKLEIVLSQNIAVDALIEKLKEGNITYIARDYGGFEKVGSIGITLPTSDINISAEAGDVMLYQGNQIVIFYGENRYSYTRIGRIKEYSTAQLKSALNAGNGNVHVTLSLD